ncbi:hypothetical protein [Clostridium manihotivorum]|uniref:Sigma-Y antisigma factor component n=1 Tax=Clostridium manihotivorum TaxID=2320868 RepID=A0A410DZL4_9CLOT|nr:hypothetical protein [Clostridium manihotivorum]QAA34498.1 hypothetical protein C1I91_24250 [Clostridium manihotivorum]
MMLTVAQIIFLIILVVIQGTLIFRDAIKDKVPNPWLWGIIGLLNIPSSAIVYLVYKKLYFKRKK